jgi:hypothetical protein
MVVSMTVPFVRIAVYPDFLQKNGLATEERQVVEKRKEISECGLLN